MATYTITVGDRFGTVTNTYAAVDPDAIGPADIFPADGLQVGWELPGEWPCQPSAVEARFALIGPVVDPLLDIGSVCSVVVETAGAADTVVEFYGRVTDLTATPVAYRAGGVVVEGQRVEVIAVDYTADLGEIRFDDTAATDASFIDPDYFLSEFPMGDAWIAAEVEPSFAYPPQFPQGFPDGLPYTPPGVILNTADPSYLLRGWGDTEDPGSVLSLLLDVLRQTPRLDAAGTMRGGRCRVDARRRPRRLRRHEVDAHEVGQPQPRPPADRRQRRRRAGARTRFGRP